MTDAPEIEAVTEQFYTAVNQLQQGDPEPMFALWSHRADVLNLGPQGGRQQGWAEVQRYFARAAELAAGSPEAVYASAHDVVTIMLGEIAVVAATEEVQVSNAGHVQQFTARATNIYGREGNAWKLVYRHADAPPVMGPARTPTAGGGGDHGR